MTGKKSVNLKVVSGLRMMKCGLEEKKQWEDISFETSHLENTTARSRELVREQKCLRPLHGSLLSSYFRDITGMKMKDLEF